MRYCLEGTDMFKKSNIFIWARKDSQKGLLVLQVMMMVLPLLIIVLLPKVVNTNDPEMRKVSGCYVFCIVFVLKFLR